MSIFNLPPPRFPELAVLLLRFVDALAGRPLLLAFIVGDIAVKLPWKEPFTLMRELTLD